MHISNNVKLIGNGVGMPIAAFATWAAIAYVTVTCFLKHLQKSQTIPQKAKNIVHPMIALGVPTILTFGILPRILPFTKVSYGIVPHWNWEWIQARLPSGG